MANVVNFVGSYRKGDTIRVPVEHFDDSWVAGYYDVVDNYDRTLILEDQATVAGGGGWSDHLRWANISVSEANFEEGRDYTIIFKAYAGSPGTTDNPESPICLCFSVDPEHRQNFLGTVEKGKTFRFMVREEKPGATYYFDVIDPDDGTTILANQTMSGPLPGPRIYRGSIDTELTDDLTIGRSYYIRVKTSTSDTPAWDALFCFSVLPPLEADLARIKGMLGENLVLDNFSYDQAGNITGLRMRVFEDATSADNASEGVTDPEPGEVAAYDITQEHDVPRNVRTFHKSVLEFLSVAFPGDG